MPRRGSRVRISSSANLPNGVPSLTTTLKSLAPTQVELEIPILPEELAAAEERAFRKLAKKAKIPGFRPGKAPRRVFEQQYGSHTVANAAMEDIVPEAYSRAVKEHELDPVERPHMEVLPPQEGVPVTIKAVVSVRPKFSLGEYTGLPVQREPVVVSDGEVERSLESLARERATLVPVDRPVQLGDIVSVDYEGTIDGVPFEGGTAKGQTLEVAEDRFIPGFAAGIVGMKSGEAKTIETQFPADYSNAELAGKTATFSITVHEVKELELPKLDDEFAASVSTSKTLDALKSDIRNRLGAIAEGKVKKSLSNQVMQQLLEKHELPLPEIMVERELESLLEDAQRFAQRMGLTWEQYLTKTEKTEESVREEFRAEASRRVKGTLLIEEIAKKEKIEATPADVEAELAGLAAQYQQPRERILEALRPNIATLIQGIVRTKTVDYLVEHATVTQAS